MQVTASHELCVQLPVGSQTRRYTTPGKVQPYQQVVPASLAVHSAGMPAAMFPPQPVSPGSQTAPQARDTPASSHSPFAVQMRFMRRGVSHSVASRMHAPQVGGRTVPALQPVPVLLQVCSRVPSQRVVPGVQTARHTPCAIVPLTHVPRGSHVRGTVPRQPLIPGGH